MLVHYLKWILPWMVLLATGEIFRWASSARQSIFELASVTILTVLLANIGLKIGPIVTATDVRDAVHGTISIDLQNTTKFDVLDISNVPGDLYQPIYNVEIDGLDLPRPAFYMLPAPWGTRIVFMHRHFGRKLTLFFFPSFKGLTNSVGTSRVATYRFSLNCRFVQCEQQTFLTAPARPVESSPDLLFMDFAKQLNSEFRLGNGWGDIEAWGRWTTAEKATVQISAQPHGFRHIRVAMQPMINYLRRQQTVTVLVNSCPVITGSFRFPADERPATLLGQIPQGCTEAGRPIVIAISTNETVVPAEFMATADRRTLGIGVTSISLN
jgi:hypothetical protein